MSKKCTRADGERFCNGGVQLNTLANRNLSENVNQIRGEKGRTTRGKKKKTVGVFVRGWERGGKLFSRKWT